MSTALEVDLQAVAANARALRRLLEPAAAAFVVKANAYGHGLVPVARAVAPLAQRLCVYSLAEACTLREDGIDAPILVMGPIEPSDLSEAASRDIEIALWDDRGYLHDAAQAATRNGAPQKVHVKIDTGVARLGFSPEDAPRAIETIASKRGIEVAGVFSHLAAAEELDSPFTMTQLERFARATNGVRAARHIAASAAAMLWPQTRLDFARIGIALYGLWPSPQTRTAIGAQSVELHPALRFTTNIVSIRNVSAGTPVGYGCAYHAAKDTRIGVIPIGYADGIPRALSNTGEFLVRGARCSIAGRVCMNMTMLDLAGAPDARVGDTVTLIGTDGAATVSIEDWASWAGTIAYEIAARLPEHLPRSYR